MQSTENSVLDIQEDIWKNAQEDAKDIKGGTREDAEKNIIEEDTRRDEIVRTNIEEDIRKDIRENVLKNVLENVSRGISSGIPGHILRGILKSVLKDVLRDIPRGSQLDIPREHLIELLKEHHSLGRVSEELKVSVPVIRRKLLNGQIMSIPTLKRRLGIIGTNRAINEKVSLVLKLFDTPIP